MTDTDKYEAAELEQMMHDAGYPEVYSGMIGDTEVRMHCLAKFTWAIDIIKHTSDDTTELVDGWVVGDEQKALALYDEKVKELQERIE